MFHITQPKSVYGLLDGYYFGWCPIAPKWDYQSLQRMHRRTREDKVNLCESYEWMSSPARGIEAANQPISQSATQPLSHSATQPLYFWESGWMAEWLRWKFPRQRALNLMKHIYDHWMGTLLVNLSCAIICMCVCKSYLKEGSNRSVLASPSHQLETLFWWPCSGHGSTPRVKTRCATKLTHLKS